MKAAESPAVSASPIPGLVGLMLTGFLIRMAVANWLGGGLHTPYIYDEVSYASLGERLATGQGFTEVSGSPTAYRMPGLPAILSILYFIKGPGVVASRVYMCALCTLVIPVCFAMSRYLAGVRAGWIAAVIATIMPSWVFMSGQVLTDVICATLIGGIFLVLKDYKGRRSLLLLGGVVWAAAVYVRSPAIGLAPAVLGWPFLVEKTWKKRCAAAATIFFAFVLVIGPWSVRNTKAFGRWVNLSTQEGPELYKSANPDATGILSFDILRFDEVGLAVFPAEKYPNDAERSHLYSQAARHWMMENPGRFLQLMGIKFIQLWKIFSPRVSMKENLAMAISFGPVLILFLMNAVRSLRRPSPQWLLLGLIACHTLVHCIFTSQVRYRIPIEPLVVAMAAAELAYWWDRFRPPQPTTPIQVGTHRTAA